MENRYGEVYVLTNTVNGKVYVGQTTLSAKKRWAKHCIFAKRGSNDCPLLYTAIRKYGKEAFTIEVVAIANSQLHLNTLEIKEICKRKSTDKNIGYNISIGGEGTGNGFNHPSYGIPSPKKGIPATEEFRAKVSASCKAVNYRHTEEAKQKISEALRNRPPISETTREKLSQAQAGSNNSRFGTRHSDEHREYMRAKITGRIWVRNSDNGERKRVHKEELPEYLAQGWLEGRGPNKKSFE